MNIMSLAVIQLILHILRTMYTVFMSQLQYILCRLVGEGLNPEKINIKAILVSFCSARYQE